MVKITVTDAQVTAAIKAVATDLQIAGKASEHGADRCVAQIRRHLASLAQTRHKTARRLGATPTGHIRAQAARRLSATPTGAEIEVAIPGIARAYRDITIRPRKKAALTIPVHALAYGKTVSTLAREILFSPTLAGQTPIFKPKGKDYLATADKEGNLTVLYLLRKSVSQPQDPTLLPTLEELGQTYAQGYANAVAQLFKKGTP